MELTRGSAKAFSTMPPPPCKVAIQVDLGAALPHSRVVLASPYAHEPPPPPPSFSLLQSLQRTNTEKHLLKMRLSKIQFKQHFTFNFTPNVLIQQLTSAPIRFQSLQNKFLSRLRSKLLGCWTVSSQLLPFPSPLACCPLDRPCQKILLQRASPGKSSWHRRFPPHNL